MSKRLATSLLLAVLAGVAIGFLARSALTVCEQRNQRSQRWRTEFQYVVWSLSEHFCPKGYRILEKLAAPDDERAVELPAIWYGGRQNSGIRVTQESLAWANDEKGFVIVVHMVPTEVYLGRGPLAFPVAYAINDQQAKNSFPGDYYLVGARDRTIFFFQMVPLSPGRSSQPPAYPGDWIGLFRSFISEFREFVDVWANPFPLP